MEKHIFFPGILFGSFFFSVSGSKMAVMIKTNNKDVCRIFYGPVLCRLLFKHPNSPPFNVKLGLCPIQNCQRKQSCSGGWVGGLWCFGGGGG